MEKKTIGLESKYHDEAVTAVKWTGGKAVVLLVVEGYKGTGMAVSCAPGPHQTLGEPRELAAFLRRMADSVEQTGYAGVTRSSQKDEPPS